MDNPDQETITSNYESQSLGSQDSWSSDSSDSQNSLNSFISDDSCSDEEFWNGVEKFWNGVEERKQCK